MRAIAALIQPRPIGENSFPNCGATHIHPLRTRIFTDRSFRFFEFERWSFALSHDGKFPDYAEVWTEANRSRAQVLRRYFSAAAAFFQRWIQRQKNAADRASPGSLSRRNDVGIAERAVRTAGK